MWLGKRKRVCGRGEASRKPLGCQPFRSEGGRGGKGFPDAVCARSGGLGASSAGTRRTPPPCRLAVPQLPAASVPALPATQWRPLPCDLETEILETSHHDISPYAVAFFESLPVRDLPSPSIPDPIPCTLLPQWPESRCRRPRRDSKP